VVINKIAIHQNFENLDRKKSLTTSYRGNSEMKVLVAIKKDAELVYSYIHRYVVDEHNQYAKSCTK
jgi:hypothetical protein